MAEIKNNNISTREFLSQRIDGLEEKIMMIFNFNKESADKAEKTMEIRLEEMNEYQEAKFVTKEELSLYISKLDSSIKALEINKALLEGKASQRSVNITLFFSISAFIFGIIGIINIISKLI